MSDQIERKKIAKIIEDYFAREFGKEYLMHQEDFWAKMGGAMEVAKAQVEPKHDNPAQDG